VAEDSPTDIRVNEAGRGLVNDMRSLKAEMFPGGIGRKKMTRQEVNQWVYDKLCDESKISCKVKTKGPLDDDTAKRLVKQLDNLRVIYGPNWWSLPWDLSGPGLPSPTH
jgi:hypothetical protein